MLIKVAKVKQAGPDTGDAIVHRAYKAGTKIRLTNKTNI